MSVLAIDFGTAATVGVVRDPDGGIRPLLFDGSPLLPSAVYLDADGTLLVGGDARRRAGLDPGRFEARPGRWVGERRIRLGGRRLRVTAMIGAVLAHVEREAHRVLGVHPAEIRIACPVHRGRHGPATVLPAAARDAGLSPVRLVPVPVAAATYLTAVLGHPVPVGRCLAVHHLDDGSFEASVVRRTPTGFDVLSVGSLPTGSQAGAETGADTGADDEDPATVHADLDRDVRVLARVIGAAGLRPQDLAGICLVGGSSRLPLVAPLVRAVLGITPTVPERPATAVAEGALYVGPVAVPPFGQLPRQSPPGRTSPRTGTGGSLRPAQPAPPAADRHLVAEMPVRVRIGREFSVIVEIRGRPAGPGQYGRPLPVVADPGGTRLWIIVRVDPGLEVLANSEDTMVVRPDRDSTPARFALRATAPGTHSVRVSAWSGGTFLTEVVLRTSADVDRVDAGPRRVGAVIGPTRARAGEATLLVDVEGGRYSFRWLTDGFLSNRTLAEPLAGPPDAAVARTIGTLRRIVEQESGYSPSNARRWVTETGVGLWQDMVPDPIKDQYWNLRGTMRALHIACSDDWMPWELLHPRAPGRDDGFLVHQLPVLRLVPDRHRSPVLGLRDAHCVVPPNSPTNAKDEVDAVRRALLGAGVDGISDRDIDSLDDLLDMLDSGSTGLLHFACHNGYSVESGGSFIRMAGGNFVPALLNSLRTDGTLARTSPLVFLNACRSAGVAPYYTRMMGWAEQFMAAGAGAFVGTLWPVETRRAAAFAEAFYASLLAGETLGVAGLTARRTIEDPADPSWLAYTIYGDPNAVASFRK